MSIMASLDQVSPIHRGPHLLGSIATTSTISMTTTYHDSPPPFLAMTTSVTQLSS